MGTCEECKWANNHPAPKGEEPLRQQDTFLGRWFGSTDWDAINWNVRNDIHQLTISCTRYPQRVNKRKFETCGEFTLPGPPE